GFLTKVAVTVLYERWPGVCLEGGGAPYVELLPELQALAAQGRVIDKPAYSGFSAPAFVALLEAEDPSCLLFSGVETDMCVLATLLQAVDRGYRAVLAGDAVASARTDVHEAVLHLLDSRLGSQVDCATTEAVVAAWR
ncbi:MAG: isochorismatase family protein, partial [Tistlia sp.]